MTWAGGVPREWGSGSGFGKRSGRAIGESQYCGTAVTGDRPRSTERDAASAASRPTRWAPSGARRAWADAGHRRLAGSPDGGVSAVPCLGICLRPARLHDQRAADGAVPPEALRGGRVRRLPEHQLYSHALFAGAQFGHGPMVSGVQVSGDLDWVCGSNGVSGQITPCLTSRRERCRGDRDTG